jgi:hypothetical protein
MAYLKINNIDVSMYVSGLKVNKAANYSAQTNAAGNTVVDYINTKRTVEATIIAVNDEAMRTIQSLLNDIQISLAYRNPSDGELETITCILPQTEIEYYTIQADNVRYNAFTLIFTEL